jgi:hypothetical protein
VEDAHLDGLELLAVLARLEGRRKRQIEGGGGELDIRWWRLAQTMQGGGGQGSRGSRG